MDDLWHDGSLIAALAMLDFAPLRACDGRSRHDEISPASINRCADGRTAAMLEQCSDAMQRMQQRSADCSR